MPRENWVVRVEGSCCCVELLGDPKNLGLEDVLLAALGVLAETIVGAKVSRILVVVGSQQVDDFEDARDLIACLCFSIRRTCKPLPLALAVRNEQLRRSLCQMHIHDAFPMYTSAEEAKATAG